MSRRDVRALCAVSLCLVLVGRVSAQPVEDAPPDAPVTEDAASLAAQAAVHFREGRFAEALAAYARALEVAGEAERAVLEFDVAACLFELGRYDEARAHFLESAARDASFTDVARLHAALAALAMGDRAFAERALADVPPGDEEVETVRAALVDALAAQAPRDDVGPEETASPTEVASPIEDQETARIRPRLWVSAEIGWDGNPAQSGSAVASGVAGGAGRGRAPYVGVVTSLGATYVLNARMRLGVGYVGGYTAILDGVYDTLSLQDHGGELELRHGRDGTTLMASVRGGCTRVGLAPTQPWYCVAASRLRLDRRLAEHVTLRAFVDAGMQAGRSGYAYLSGPDVAVDADTRITFARGDLALGGRVRYLGLGTLERPLDGMSFAACGPRCGGETYRIPLAYLEVAPRIDVAYAPVRRLTFRARAALERRRYTGTSAITNVPESRARRRDTRARLRLRGELVLDAHEVSFVFIQYELLASASNVALDASDPGHALDYDDRSFSQHLVALGIAVAR